MTNFQIPFCNQASKVTSGHKTYRRRFLSTTEPVRNTHTRSDRRQRVQSLTVTLGSFVVWSLVFELHLNALENVQFRDLSKWAVSNKKVVAEWDQVAEAKALTFLGSPQKSGCSTPNKKKGTAISTFLVKLPNNAPELVSQLWHTFWAICPLMY